MTLDEMMHKDVVENRKTIRAAIGTLPIGMAQKALVLAMIDRHFDFETRVLQRLDFLEGIRHGD